MMFIRPIPQIMMPFSIQFSSYTESSRYSDTYADPITINHVRVVPKSQLKYAQTNETVDWTSLLFIDSHTSKQLDISGVNEVDLTIEPKEKDKVTLNGVTFLITSANPLYIDSEEIHHWECTLNRT